jgi:preprotein translocase subunit SecG
MNQLLFYSQIAVSVILVILIALQQRGTALGSAFGGGGEFYSARRGIQKNIYYATIVVAALFIVLGIVNIILQ